MIKKKVINTLSKSKRTLSVALVLVGSAGLITFSSVTADTESDAKTVLNNVSDVASQDKDVSKLMSEIKSGLSDVSDAQDTQDELKSKESTVDASIADAKNKESELKTSQSQLKSELESLQAEVKKLEAEKAEKEKQAAEATTTTTETTSNTSSNTTSATLSATTSSTSSKSFTVGQERAAFEQIVKDLGISASDKAVWEYVINRESGWSSTATNASSGAYGLGQALPGSKMAVYGSDYMTNPYTQLLWMYNYIVGRYGTFANLQAFWNANNWY